MSSDVNALRDKLTGALIGLARATFGNEHLVTEQTNLALVEALLARNGSDAKILSELIDRVEREKRKLIPLCYECAMPCGKNNAYDMQDLQRAEENVRNIKSLLLLGIRTVAVQTETDAGNELCRLICKALFAIGEDDWGVDELLPIALKLGQVGLVE